ncbi:hypothetical protein MUN81_06335 [Hymenobacter sp. 5317J-9]|uniref:hypothetical protein n=1 Tax=Hymenobacter sp. 5317J-9 TaxID=2932250 RepID=UPI001FD66220|nr:hypothetical protein [Hymenobacter sp. 5317J-9]UOQ99106.1 hypothetical protein MUN81_06335 [Hymenobacter sp. 5317J-9]
MKLTYPASAPIAKPSALTSTLHIWLFSNLGGTAHLLASFGVDSPSDLLVPLAMGLLAGLVSLAAVPVAWPVFVLAQRACAGWQCRAVALLGVLLAFAAANGLLLRALPLGPPASLLVLTWPYLLAALVAVAWRYWLQPAAGTGLRPAGPAPLLNAWQQRVGRQPLAHLAH